MLLEGAVDNTLDGKIKESDVLLPTVQFYLNFMTDWEIEIGFALLIFLTDMFRDSISERCYFDKTTCLLATQILNRIQLQLQITVFRHVWFIL
jgi:hypothetical protein